MRSGLFSSKWISQDKAHNFKAPFPRQLATLIPKDMLNASSSHAGNDWQSAWNLGIQIIFYWWSVPIFQIKYSYSQSSPTMNELMTFWGFTQWLSCHIMSFSRNVCPHTVFLWQGKSILPGCCFHWSMVPRKPGMTLRPVSLNWHRTNQSLCLALIV